VHCDLDFGSGGLHTPKFLLGGGRTFFPSVRLPFFDAQRSDHHQPKSTQHIETTAAERSRQRQPEKGERGSGRASRSANRPPIILQS